MFQYSLHISGECNFSSFFEWELRERGGEGEGGGGEGGGVRQGERRGEEGREEEREGGRAKMGVGGEGGRVRKKGVNKARGHTGEV